MTSSLPTPARSGASGVPPSVLALTAALAGAAVLVAVIAERLGPSLRSPTLMLLLGVLLALVVAGMLNLEYHFRGQKDAFDYFEVALVPALYFLPPTHVVVLAAIAKLVCQLQRRVQPRKAAFNVAQWSAAAGTGALVFAWLRDRSPLEPSLLPLALATLAIVLVNKTSVVLVLALVHRRLPRPRLSGGTASLLRSTAVTGVLNISFGVLFVATLVSVPEASPLLLVPLALLHWASRGYAVGRMEQMRVRMTRLATSALGAGADSDAAMANFLAAVGVSLDRDAVDLIVTVPAGLELRRWRQDTGVATSETVPLDQASPLTRALLSIDRPIRVDATDGDAALRQLLVAEGKLDCAAAPLPVTPESEGVLALYGPRSAVALPDIELAIIAELAREVGLAWDRALLARAVVEERAKMTQIVTETGDGIVTLGPDGTVQTWNPALERITGYLAAEVVRAARLSILDPIDATGRPLSLADWSAGPDDPPEDVLVRTRTGERRWLSCSYARGSDGTGTPDRLIVMARDVTELKYTEARLAGQTAVLELIASGEEIELSLQVLVDDLARSDEDLACAVLLTSLADPVRLEPTALSGVTAAVLADLDALRVAPRAGWSGRAVHRGRAMFVDDLESHPDAASILPGARAHGFRSCSAVPIRASDGDRIIGVLVLLGTRPRRQAEARDRELLERAAHLAAVAVARSQFESQLAHQATHDALTGLPNRALLLERCEHGLATSHGGAAAVMLFLDVDRFKLVNDSMGHEAGDQLLVEVGERLRRVVRPDDTVARFGGDEFTVLCEGLPDETFVFDLANRVQAIFGQPFALRGSDVIATASVGVAVGLPGTGADELVNNADAAMYRAKERGGNRYEIYEASMRGPALLHLVTHNALHRALDNGELVVIYQPIVSLISGAVIGVEALLRWSHPDRGLLGPESFLPLAENTGLIIPIGAHVISVACEQARQWERSGPHGEPLRMNINLSARELGQGDLPRQVARALATSGVDAGSICFEITESALLYDLDATAATLRQLKDLGVDLAIDDFGTGYSALTHLRRFPVDGLKIDRSFVAGLDDADDRAIVTAVIGLARALQLSTIAEGVETPSQLALLQELGCEAAQGFLLAMPKPPEEIVSMWAPAMGAG